MSISATTRPMRPGETDGEDYIFVDEPAFRKMIEEGELLEHATVFGNLYGTPKAEVDKALAAGNDVLFDVDWQGTQQLVEHDREDVVSVFILPPSIAELEQRLRNRAQDSDEVVAGRMARAADEMSHYTEYDYIIVNEDVEVSMAEVRAILTAVRLRRSQQVGLHQFVENLRNKE
jgi:guanylate kinase